MTTTNHYALGLQHSTLSVAVPLPKNITEGEAREYWAGVNSGKAKPHQPYLQGFRNEMPTFPVSDDNIAAYDLGCSHRVYGGPLLPMPAEPAALAVQEGGTHYKDMAIQPIEFIHANNLDFFQGNIVKYASRHKLKNGAEDLRKVIHYAQLALQLQYPTK